MYIREQVFKASLNYFNGDELAADVFADKYALYNPENNKYYELTPDDMHRRMAKEFARIEAKYPNPRSEEEIYQSFKNFKYIVPQGSPMSGVGNPFQIVSLSNCFVIPSPSDSYGGILKTDQEQAQIMKRRGGVGFDISNIRPRGLTTSNAAKTTDGIGVFMERFSNTCREVAQNGRRGALMLSISVHHPEIETFINIKKDRKKVTGANISIRVSDEFMKAVQEDGEYEQRWPLKNPKITKKVKARQVWDQIVQAAWESAEPGVLFWDNIAQNSPADIYVEEGFQSESTNPCVPGYTEILTDCGYKSIESLVGKEVMVWNGSKFSSILPRVTGFNQPMVKVVLSSGQELVCTEAHIFILNNGKRVAAKNLNPGDKLIKTDYPVIETGDYIHPKEAYTQGFKSGDGMNGYNFMYLYGSKIKCGDRMAVHWTGEPSLADRKKVSFTYEPKDKNFVPFIWNLKGRLEWFAGLLDSDGCELKEGGAQITSVDKKFLLNVQKLLTTMGTASKVQFMKPAVRKLMPDGNGGYKEFDCQDCYRLTIGAKAIQKLKEIGLNCSRLKFEKFPNRDASRFVEVVEVMNYGIEDVVYCFTEEELHQGCFEGIVTGQCGEIPICPFDSCRLVVLNTIGFVNGAFTSKAQFDHEKFAEYVKLAQRIMDDLVDLEIECIDKIINKIKNDPEDEFTKLYELDLWENIKFTCIKGRRTGLGVTAIADTLAALGVIYGSKESVEIVRDIYHTLEINSYWSSIQLAEERGAFPIWNYKKEKDHKFLNSIIGELPIAVQKQYKKTGRRNIANTTTAPAGSVSMMTQTSSGVEPVFKLSYDRYKKINPTDVGAKVDRVDEVGDKWTKYPVFHPGFKLWMDATGKTNVEDSPYYKSTANEIDWEARVDLQAAAQSWLCHSISSTINLPNDVPVSVVNTLYQRAWEKGCKGVTIYRDGSRSGVLVSENENSKADLEYHHAPKRPELLECEVHRVSIKGEPWTVFLGLFNGKPYEIMGGKSEYILLPKRIKDGVIRKNKKKGEATYDFLHGEGEEQIVIKDLAKTFENPTHGSFTRTISLALRHGTPIQYVVEQLQKGDRESDMFTFSKVIGRVLKNKISDGTKVNKTCNECSSDNLSYQQGCITCLNCGWSKCT